MNPPYSLEDLVGNTKSMKGIMNVVQPLGLGYLAAILEQDGHEVNIEDCQCLGTTSAELADILTKKSPHIVGISATTPTFGSSIFTASMVKQQLPDAIVVIGGAQVCALPEVTMSYDCFDVGVWGEGELTMLELAAHIGSNGLTHLDRVKGVVFKHNGSVVQTERRPLIRDLDQLPFPARHLLPPLSKYHPAPTSYRRLPNATIMTSRGCAGALCAFCDRSGMGFGVRFRSVESVFNEIEELINVHGAEDIKFFDDTFTLNSKRVFQICKEFETRGIDIPWCCLARTNTVSREMLKAMKDAGCWQILYGLESMDENVLRNLKKLTTVEQNVQAVKWSHEVGISVRANFIVGTPFDTWETMEKNVREAIKLNMDFAHFNKFTPYPGCELYNTLVAEGHHYDPAKWDSQHDMKGTIMYTPPGISEDEYRRWLVDAHRRYYLRARYILKQLSKVRTPDDLRRLWSGFRAVTDL